MIVNDLVRSYFKIFWRDLVTGKWYSFIRILSLTIGFIVFATIFAYLRFESGFERFHKNAGEIFCLLVRVPEYYMGKNEIAVTPGPLAQAIKREMPEVSRATRIERRNVIIDNGGELISEGEFLCVDRDFLEIFSFPMIKGDTGKVLQQPFTLIITESAARKYFDDEDPLGRTIMVDKSLYTIEGVIKDPPENTQIRFSFLSSFLTTIALNGEEANSSWENWEYYTFVRLIPDADINSLNEKLSVFLKKYSDDSSQTLFLRSILRMRHDTKVNFLMSPPVDPKPLKILAVIATLILLVAGINYVNLSTARALYRAREVGLRKVAGAGKSDLVYQFLGESIAISLFSLVIALIIAYVVIPSFGDYLGQSLESRSVIDISFIGAMVVLAVLFGFISGIYPALYTSSFQPLYILKGEKKGLRGSFVRNSLVVSQFIVSTILIFSSVVIIRQLNYLLNKDLGYERKMVVGVRFFEKKSSLLKNELSGNNMIMDMAVSNQLPTDIGNAGIGIWDDMGTDQRKLIYRIAIDEHFLDFYDIPVLESEPGLTGSRGGNSYLVNQSAVKSIGWKEPVGSKFGFDKDKMGLVTGIIKDFNFASLHLGVDPLAVSILRSNDEIERGWLSLKISPDNIDKTLLFIRGKWQKIFPDNVFSYYFLEEKVREKYRAELKLRTSLLIFTLIAIFTACLGLFVLATFIAERRRKETGIRKVFGADTGKIIVLFLVDFLKLVFAAIAVALPAGYVIASQWLKNFAYHIDIGWEAFIISTVLSLLIALLTVILITIKSSLANPADTVRYQ